jgi:DNA-binding MarR family transcriptional regulator
MRMVSLKQIFMAMNKPGLQHQPSHNAGSYKFSEQIGHLLRRAYQRHVAIFQETIPDSYLTAAQFVAMCAIKDFKSCSLTDLVKATAIDQATIRGIVDRLKSRHLIEISHDESDRRKVLIRLSPKGIALINETVPFAWQISENTLGNLNAAERVALTYLLRKMCGLEGNDAQPNQPQAIHDMESHLPPEHSGRNRDKPAKAKRRQT